MLEWFNRVVVGVGARFLPDEGPLPPEIERYYSLVEQAKQEWQDAKRRFNEVSDPDLVDYAIYALEAAERRYVYLLKKARNKNCPLTGICEE